MALESGRLLTSIRWNRWVVHIVAKCEGSPADTDVLFWVVTIGPGQTRSRSRSITLRLGSACQSGSQQVRCPSWGLPSQPASWFVAFAEGVELLAIAATYIVKAEAVHAMSGEADCTN